MLYHGSKTGNIKILKPNYSIHGKKYVYLSTLRSVALIYTSNAIERYFEVNCIKKPASFHNWYSYGFEDEKPYLSEYYPNAIKETYSGVSGYIYKCREPEDIKNPTHIFCARVSASEVMVDSVEFIEDVYLEFLNLEKEGLIEIRRFEMNTNKMNDFVRNMIKEEIDKDDLLNKNDNNYTIFLKLTFGEKCC